MMTPISERQFTPRDDDELSPTGRPERPEPPPFAPGPVIRLCDLDRLIERAQRDAERTRQLKGDLKV